MFTGLVRNCRAEPRECRCNSGKCNHVAHIIVCSLNKQCAAVQPLGITHWYIPLLARAPWTYAWHLYQQFKSKYCSHQQFCDRHSCVIEISNCSNHKRLSQLMLIWGFSVKCVSDAGMLPLSAHFTTISTMSASFHQAALCYPIKTLICVVVSVNVLELQTHP